TTVSFSNECHLSTQMDFYYQEGKDGELISISLPISPPRLLCGDRVLLSICCLWALGRNYSSVLLMIGVLSSRIRVSSSSVLFTHSVSCHLSQLDHAL